MLAEPRRESRAGPPGGPRAEPPGGPRAEPRAGPVADGAPASRAPAPPGSPWRSIPIDLARDPPWVLRLLPGVGPSRASALVRDRETNGPLPTVDAVARVPGFGERSAATLSAAGAVAAAPRERDEPAGDAVRPADPLPVRKPP